MESTSVANSGDIKMVDLAVFAPHVREQVETMLMEGNLGLSHEVVEVMNPRPSFNHDKAEDYDCDRFQLIIPYAGTSFECMVVFQSMDVTCPPDFIFSDQSFFLPFNEIKSLVAWDVKNPSALLSTIKEIMQVYKKKQILELKKHDSFCYKQLCRFQLTEFKEDDIEVIIPPEPDSPVHFLIRLHVNLHSYFSEFYNEGFEIEENPLMLVTFPHLNSNKSNQTLYLTKNMETLLGMESTFKFSLKITGMKLSQCLLAIQKKIKSKCELSAFRYQQRKLYFSTFRSYFEKYIVEYDMMFYSSMVLLLKDGSFHFMVEINLSDNFPTETPALVFRSIYHTFMGQPVQIAIDSYSAHWPMNKVLEETVNCMKEYAPLFRQDSASSS